MRPELELGERVISIVLRHPAVRGAWLEGSRERGDTTALSDWDIHVDVDPDAFDSLVADLPRLVEELEPLGQQWDRLSDHWNYMLLVSGPVKIDLIFDLPYEMEPAWSPAAANLGQIEHHFWDWTLWLGSKVLHGEDDRVRSELDKMFDHLLAPLGVEKPPEDLADAIAAFRAARERAEERFEVRVPRDMETEVVRAFAENGLLERTRPDAADETGRTDLSVGDFRP